MSARSTRSCRRWRRQDIGRSCRTSAVTVPPQFRDSAAPRMAEQAAIGQDVIDFADALRLPRFAVSGYDWGGRAAAITAALHPDRVRATVLVGGYTVQNTVAPQPPAVPEAEHRLWYQYYFNTERGRAGLAANRHAICRYLWRQWSPSWRFTDEAYNRTAASFDNPDFVDVVIHSYRHRIGNAPGEARFKDVEARLANATQDSGAFDHAVWRRGRDRPPACRITTRRAGRVRTADRSPGRRGRGSLHAARAPRLRCRPRCWSCWRQPSERCAPDT